MNNPKAHQIICEPAVWAAFAKGAAGRGLSQGQYLDALIFATSSLTQIGETKKGVIVNPQGWAIVAELKEMLAS